MRSLAKKAKWGQLRYQQRRAEGKCAPCGGEPEVGRVLCAACAKVQSDSHRKTYGGRIEKGLCVRCVGPTDGPSQCKACRDLVNKRRRDRKLLVMARYGGKCACCGEAGTHFLTIDHIDGDGAAHRRKVGNRFFGGDQIYRLLEKQGFPEGFQVLCWNCNMGKQLSGTNTCPHAAAL